MTSRDFAYWLQGYFEIADLTFADGLKPTQVQMIKKHLALVFKHEIDPSYGDDEQQMLHLSIIVNGTPTKVIVTSHDKLLFAAEKALLGTQNTGRPISDWEIKKDDRMLSMGERMNLLGLKDGDKLFLSLKAGIGA